MSIGREVSTLVDTLLHWLTDTPVTTSKLYTNHSYIDKLYNTLTNN